MCWALDFFYVSEQSVKHLHLPIKASLPPPRFQVLALLWVQNVVYVVRRRGRLAPRQPLSVCALLPAYEGNRHLRPLGNLGHRLRRPRWID